MKRNQQTLLLLLFWSPLVGTSAEPAVPAEPATHAAGAASAQTVSSQQEPKRVVMARVGPAEITVKDFMQFIALNPERVRKVASGAEGKAEVLRIMIANVLLQQAMVQEGLLPENPSKEDYDKALEQLYEQRFSVPEITDEAAVKAFYDAHIEDYGIPATARISQIQFRFPKEAEEAVKAEVKARAEAALKRVEAGEPFAEVARDVSENPGAKEQSGDLGFIERLTWSDWLKNALDGVEVGEHTGVMPSPIGFEILMVTDEREALTTPFDDAREDVKRRMQREQQEKLQEEFVKQLAKKVPIEVVLDNLKEEFSGGIFP